MAIYYCEECGHMKDGDWYPAEEHPRDSLELCCPDCIAELEEEMEAEVNGEDFRKPRIPFARNGAQALAVNMNWHMRNAR